MLLQKQRLTSVQSMASRAILHQLNTFSTETAIARQQRKSDGLNAISDIRAMMRAC